MSASLLKADSDHFPCHVGNVPIAAFVRVRSSMKCPVVELGRWRANFGDANWIATAEAARTLCRACNWRRRPALGSERADGIGRAAPCRLRECEQPGDVRPTQPAELPQGPC